MSINYNNHNLTTNGTISASSGIYNDSLSVSGIPVSLEGHLHTSSDITDFNSAIGDNIVGGSGIIISDNKQWIQRGQDIDGEAANDNSGEGLSFSKDGNILAIGAILNDGNGVDSGSVRVYVWNGSSWIQRGSDIDGEAANDASGFSVSLNDDGSILAISAINNDGNGNNSGHVRVYVWNGSSWIQRGSDIDGEAAEDRGRCVKLSSDGSILAISSIFNSGNGIFSGSVRVYVWNGSSWIQRGSDIDGEAANDRSGISLGLSADGNILAIGSSYNAGNGVDSGHVRVYVWNGSSWIQQGSDIDGEAAGDNSGWSIDLNNNGNILAIGATYNDGNGNNSGHVRVYTWNGSSWTQLGNDINGEAANNLSGWSVSLNDHGNILAVGSRLNADNGFNSGHVRVYTWNGSSWTQLGSDINGEAANDLSGHAVSLNGDGNILAIGAIWNDGNGVNSGHVRVYYYDNNTINIGSISSTNITDFTSAVSGLLPVKDIVAGTGIGVSSTSGIYTINSSNTIAADTLEPDGFVNRTDSEISFNDGSRQFSIAPKAPATSYAIYNNGTKVTKNSTETISVPDTTALYFIHFDKSTNNLSYKTTGFDFDTDIPIAQVYYNADDNKAVYFGEERHGIRMDASTHRYLHNVFGTQYVNGLSISNYTISGDGSNNSDATIAIGDGLIYDEDIEANITHSDTPNDPFEQILYPIAVIPVYYKVGSNGSWTDTTANNYPVKTGTTVQYNLNSAGTWSASNSDNPTNNRYIAYWICATTQENAPVISIMGQRIDSSLEQATSNNSWGDLNLTGLPIVELRPLYRLIYDTKSTFSNTPKGFLVDVLDIRSHIDTVTGLTQNDHGNLYGLADDDHYQYVHIDNARTIDAIHTFTNGLNASGLISAASGDFTSLTVNSTGVSLVGHTHTSSNITDFNSAVSGLLPNISNPSDGRLLTSDGTSTGIDAQQYLSYDDSLQQLKITYVNPGLLTPTGNDGILRLQVYDSYNNGEIGGRLEFTRYRGTIASPTGVITGDVLGVIRTIAKSSSNVDNTVNRIRFEADGETGGSNIYTPTRIRLNSSSGPLQLDNSLILWSDGKLSHNGYMTIDDGLSAPTNVYNHSGSLSGNIAINYDYDRQIQYFSINGTTNFTKGTGWTTGTKSVDIVVAITVFATTTIAFDSNFVVEWYNPLPVFTANTTINGIVAGRYLVLLRSIGNYVQGHYIGNVTNAY